MKIEAANRIQSCKVTASDEKPKVKFLKSASENAAKVTADLTRALKSEDDSTQKRFIQQLRDDSLKILNAIENLY
jgi:phosphate uptake regulator